ncbi:hypothetical protein P879_01213 [Paragonimus westermani]|uniref:Myosin motor domain-containing protein n=1 Tax=Paragonimus westermani TaxID=34504 RepID=A0A8T0DRF5_9TREM|nr:hypothetical protein P879_01213 [Paragonimus westermani]
MIQFISPLSPFYQTLANMYVSHTDSCESFSPTFVESWKHHRSTPNGPHSQFDHLHMASEKVEVPVWLLVRDGYKPASLLNTLPDNRCRILLLPERQEMEVDARDLERANPSSFDRIEDVADLRYSNECSVTHTLVQRFGSGQVYTYAAGQNLLAINPMVPLNIFTEGVMDLFTGAEHRRDMPPHVFSVAQLTLSRLSRSVAATQYRPRQLDAPFDANHTDSQNNHQYDAHTPCCQAICLSGRSGSGKTRASLNLLSYLLHQSNRMMAAKLQQDEHTLFSSACRRLTTERLRALFNMLDAFTCARIMLNTNANRAMRLFSMEFTDLTAVKHAAAGLSKPTGSPSLVVTGLTTRLLLFERTRVTERPEGEPNFHVFYYFLSGLEEQSRREFFLTELNEPNLFMTSLQRLEDKEAACNHWQQLCLDAQLLGFNMDDEWMSIARLLAIIYHLGCAGCVDQPQANDSIPNGFSESALHLVESSFKHLESAQRAAHLLGCSLDYLTTAVFGLVGETGRTASDSLCGFVQGLYQTTVDIVVMLINRCLSSDSSSIASSEHNPSVCAQLLLCDPPGLQAPSPGSHISSRSTPSTLATYSDLVINYANERLSHLFHETGLGLIHFRMKEVWFVYKEIRFLSFFSVAFTPLPVSYRNRSSLTTTSGQFPNSYETHQIVGRAYLRTIRRIRHSGSFVLNHNLSAFPVEYGLDSRWLSNSRLCPSMFSAHQLLQKSGPSAIKWLVSLLQTNRDYIGDARPTWTDNPSVFTEVKHQLDFVMRLFSSCATNNAGPNSHAGAVSGFNDGGSSFGVHWIHCLLPVVNAGLCQLISSSDSVTELPASAELSFTPDSSLIAGHPARICVNLIRAQLRGLNLIAILDEARSSFPDRITLSDFRHRYCSLISKSVLKRTGKCDDNQVVRAVLDTLQYPAKSFLIGKEQASLVFLKSFVLPQLNLRLKSRALVKSKSTKAKTHPSQTDEQPNQADSSERSTPSNCVPLSPIRSTHSPHITRSQVAHVTASELDRLHLDRGTPDSHAVQPNEAFRVSLAGSPSVPDMQTYLSVVAKVEQANEDLKHCHEQIEQLTNQLRVAETAVDQLRGECDEAERRARKAEQRADELLTQNSVHQTAVSLSCEQDNSEFGLNSSESIQSMLQKQVELLRTQLLEANRKIAELTASQSRPTSQLDKNGHAESPSMELNDLRKSRQELAVRVATLQSELDEVQHDLLVAKQARTRAEQNLEYVRADSKRLLDERDADVEALRTANQTRIRQLEEQLDATQMEASQANRERLQLQHDLSTVRGELNIALESMDNETDRKLLKDLKKYQTLLAEKETLLEQFIQEPPPDVGTVKQLRDRIDELDELNETNSRQKRAIQVELDDAINQLSTLQRIKQGLEDQLSKTKHESLDLQTQLEEQKTAAKEAQRQYQTVVAARSIDSATIAAQTLEINELLKERDCIRAELDELRLKFTVPEVDPISRLSVDRLELKVRELEQRLELESIVRNRLQTSLDRARETIEQLTTERDRLIASENSEKQLTRKLARQLREAQQAQDETARRAQLARRRADEAMTQADQAIRQANSSREELSALARRKQDFKTWANQREQELDLNTVENEDTCSTYSAGDKDRWLRRPVTLPIEPSVVDQAQALALATETSAFQRSRSLSLKRPRHRHARFGAVHTHRIMSAPLVGILRNPTVSQPPQPCQKPALSSVCQKQPSPTHNIAQRSEINIQRISNIRGDTTGEQRIDSPTSSSLIESSDDEPPGSRNARLSHPLSVQTLRPGVSVDTVRNAELQSALSSPILIVRELEQCSSQSLLSVDQTQKQQETSQRPFDSSCDFVTMYPQTEIARPSFLEPQTPFPSPQSTSSEATFPFT